MSDVVNPAETKTHEHKCHTDDFFLLDEHSAWLDELEPEKYPILSGDVQFSNTVNIVATADFATTVDKYKVLRENAEVEFKPYKFAALMCKIWPFGPSSSFLPMKTTDLMFENGKNVLVGATNIESARFAMQLYRQMLLRSGHKVWCKGIMLHNRVSSGHFRCRIDLDKLHKMRFMETTYEKRTFPGLIYRIHPKDLDIDTPTSNDAINGNKNSIKNIISGNGNDEEPDKEREIKVLVFDRGPIVAMGVKTDPELYKVFERIIPVLEQCKITDDTPCEKANMDLLKTTRKLRSILKTTLQQRPKPEKDAEDITEDLDEDDFEFKPNGDVILKKDKVEELEKKAKAAEKRKLAIDDNNTVEEAPAKKSKQEVIHEKKKVVYQDMPFLDVIRSTPPISVC